MAAIVFDLDGTLIDSAPDIHAAVNRMLTGEGLAPLDLPTVISFIGNGLPKLVERVMRARNIDMGRHADLTGRTLEFYDAASSVLTRVYPGAVPALEELTAQGHRLGICTNKPEAPARHVLEALDLARFFPVVVGGDTLTVRKPDPAPLHHTFTQLQADAPIYVGDSEVDAETARRAKVPFLLFTEGYRKSPVSTLPHKVSYARSDQLPDLVARLLAMS